MGELWSRGVEKGVFFHRNTNFLYLQYLEVDTKISRSQTL